MRDKLIELIKCRRDPCDIGDCPFVVDDVRPCSLCEAESLAEHLIANGVTFADDNNVGNKRNIRPIDAYTLAEEIESLQVTVGGKPAHWYDAKHTVLRMIAEQPDVPETNVGKWIPVSERLPDTIPNSAGTAYSDAVNALTSGRKVITAIWDGTDFIGDAAFWDAEDEIITHWTPVLLPLPEPPKEGNNE